VETPEPLVTLGEFPVGGRLLLRTKKDWRVAAVSRVVEDVVVLSVASPSGNTYRVRRKITAELRFDGLIPLLVGEVADEWRENFSSYDSRW
jgi:hypothetical protein